MKLRDIEVIPQGLNRALRILLRVLKIFSATIFESQDFLLVLRIIDISKLNVIIRYLQSTYVESGCKKLLEFLLEHFYRFCI